MRNFDGRSTQGYPQFRSNKNGQVGFASFLIAARTNMSFLVGNDGHDNYRGQGSGHYTETFRRIHNDGRTGSRYSPILNASTMSANSSTFSLVTSLADPPGVGNSTVSPFTVATSKPPRPKSPNASSVKDPRRLMSRIADRLCGSAKSIASRSDLSRFRPH